MSRVLVVEPDAAGRAMMDRVLASAGLATDATTSARDARAQLDAGDIDVIVIDELAGAGAPLDEVRWLREIYPSLPVIVTGALLSKRVMLELVRLGATDALDKPFTPAELRASVLGAVGRRSAHHEIGLEYAVSITEARRALARGALDDARPLLARAQATSPLDAEVMALHALAAELAGRDGDADRAYRAAIALRDEEASPAPDPYEGLARLAAYRGARPSGELAPARRGRPLRVVTDLATELGDDGGEPHLVLLSLGLTTGARGACFFREGPGPRAFVLLAASLGAEAVAAASRDLGATVVTASEPTSRRLDLDRVEELRRVAPARTT